MRKYHSDRQGTADSNNDLGQAKPGLFSPCIGSDVALRPYLSSILRADAAPELLCGSTSGSQCVWT